MGAIDDFISDQLRAMLLNEFPLVEWLQSSMGSDEVPADFERHVKHVLQIHAQGADIASDTFKQAKGPGRPRAPSCEHWSRLTWPQIERSNQKVSRTQNVNKNKTSFLTSTSWKSSSMLLRQDRCSRPQQHRCQRAQGHACC